MLLAPMRCSRYVDAVPAVWPCSSPHMQVRGLLGSPPLWTSHRLLTLSTRAMGRTRGRVARGLTYMHTRVMGCGQLCTGQRARTTSRLRKLLTVHAARVNAIDLLHQIPA